MKVINLFGGPSTGKSTTAAYLFYYLKNKNLNIEYVREYAKDVVYEGSYHKLQNQIYITAKQYKRMKDIDSNKKENVNLIISTVLCCLDYIIVIKNIITRNINHCFTS
jgi:tRNA uridine 5-carbamoylmethylation protein Kti12